MLLIKSKLKTEHSLSISTWGHFKDIANSYYNGWHIFTLNYLRIHEICIASEDVCVIRLGSMAADQALALWLPQIKACLAID